MRAQEPEPESDFNESFKVVYLQQLCRVWILLIGTYQQLILCILFYLRKRKECMEWL
jgi:hypothetical protein